MKKLLILLLLAGATLAGGAYWFNRRGADTTNGVHYTTVAVEYGTMVDAISATGVIQPRNVYVIGSETAGRVVEVAADFNQEVEEGDVLLRLDDATAKSQREQAATAVRAAKVGVSQAEAQRDTARAMLEREKDRPAEVRRAIEVEVLTNQLDAAEAALEGARTKVTQAEQALALADLALSHTVVKAPVLKASQGVKQKFLVLDRKVSYGQMVGPPLQAHLFSLAGELDVVQIEAQVAEGDVSKVARGQAADFTVASYSDADDHFRGIVTDVRLLPINDRGAVFYKVIIEAKNERDRATGRWRLTPGLTATVEIVRREHTKVWKMPAMALNFQPDETKLSDAAREKQRSWHAREDREAWKTVWVVGPDKGPWPLFVRTGGVNAAGESGIRDSSFTEVLEWDPELTGKPEGGKPGTYPEVIIAAPAGKAGLFSSPIKF